MLDVLNERVPLSPQKSGLQISVGHFSFIVSPKVDQILAQRKKSVVLRFATTCTKCAEQALRLSLRSML